jgi:hypothetical protein
VAVYDPVFADGERLGLADVLAGYGAPLETSTPWIYASLSPGAAQRLALFSVRRA